MNDPINDRQTVEAEVDAAEDGLRLDVFLAGRCDGVSRNILQAAITSGAAQVNGNPVHKRSHTVREGDAVYVTLPPAPTTQLEAENIPLDILFEDADVLVVDKPSGLVVHPAPGHPSGTLVNAVLYHCPDFAKPFAECDEEIYLRPGIVHRLDRDTSGVMVVAKSRRAFDVLSRQAREHRFDRQYVALVKGEFAESAGIIRAPIGRTVSDRKRMGINTPHSRDAVTRFRVLEALGVASQVAVQLETGRTHQIRVHMRFAGRPILGDPVYGVTDFGAWDVPKSVEDALQQLPGQALHARTLGFEHPVGGKKLTFTTTPPPKYRAVLEALQDYSRDKRA